MGFHCPQQTVTGEPIRIALLSLSLFSIIIIGCAAAAPDPAVDLEISIPEQSDWVMMDQYLGERICYGFLRSVIRTIIPDQDLEWYFIVGQYT
jgi:hypothetical protein